MAKRVISAMLDFLSPVSLVPGMGPRRVEALGESGIETIGDLLYYFPRRYIDRSNLVALKSVCNFLNETCTVTGVIKKVLKEGGRSQRLRVLIDDGTGELELLWFRGIRYYQNSFHSGSELIATGKIGKYIHFQMVHPLVDVKSAKKKDSDYKFVPQYPVTVSMREAGIQQRILQKSIEWVLGNLQHYPQLLPESIVNKKNFPSLESCISEAHFPSALSQIEKYRSRIKYEELYKTALTLSWSRRRFALPGRSMSPGDLPDRFRKMLPFALTPDQQQAVSILYSDSLRPERMHRLLHGDVGSGKTLVAFFACLPALNEGLQVMWMAPTEVLARQTFNLVSSWLSPLQIEAGLLTGGMPVMQRNAVLTGLSSGKLRFVVGTHSLFQKSVRLRAAGMMVVDEQHKFGVKQRLELQEKDCASDFLLMSATPIPQTLAKTLYGDLNLVTIKNGPQGRIPVSTHVTPEHKRSDMERFIFDQITNNKNRVYYVVPRIERENEFEEEQLKDAESVFQSFSQGVLSSVSSGLIHGRMSSVEKIKVMEKFKSGEVTLLVATSVIEVGVDVQEANIIVIENAERFGLAQLHQLRGRVGRGKEKAFCFLLTSPDTDKQTMERLVKFCKSHDGFKIADMDLEYRGPGELTGMRQSGWGDLIMADIIKDAALFGEIQEEVRRRIK